MEISDTLRIIYKTSEYIVVEKPRGMPSAPLSEDESETALGLVLECFPEGRNIRAPGRKNIEHGLVHRLDTDTCGLLAIALTQEACGYFIDIQKRGLFKKYYTAVCSRQKKDPGDGYPDFNCDFKAEGYIESFFRSYGKGGVQVRPVVAEFCGTAALKKAVPRLYRTDIAAVKSSEEDQHITCSLVQGFRHQIRCHLAWAGFPIKGDRLYNPGTEQKNLDLYACALEFPDFKTGTHICITLDGIRAKDCFY